MWKQINDLCGGVKSWKKEQWFIVLCLGILMVVIAVPDKKDYNQNFLQEEKNVLSFQGSKYEENNIRTIWELEKRLEEVLGTVSGAGEVRVMITESSKEIPYVTCEKAMQIQGVMILAQGGDDPILVKKITEAVMALFGLEAHRIKVMKME